MGFVNAGSARLVDKILKASARFGLSYARALLQKLGLNTGSIFLPHYMSSWNFYDCF